MGKSLYYKSNNAREATYEKSRREEENINNEQQDTLDEAHMMELGEVAQADKYSKLLKKTLRSALSGVVQTATTTPMTSDTDFINMLIKGGKGDSFADLWTKLKSVDTTGFSDKAKADLYSIQNSGTSTRIQNAANDAMASASSDLTRARIAEAALGKNLVNDLKNLNAGESKTGYMKDLFAKLATPEKGLKSAVENQAIRDSKAKARALAKEKELEKISLEEAKPAIPEDPFVGIKKDPFASVAKETFSSFNEKSSQVNPKDFPKRPVGRPPNN